MEAAGRETTAANQTPRVSVVMGINRDDSYLPSAIDSVLHQTFADFELLIVVDQSSPDLQARLRTQYVGDWRVRVLQSPSLGGLALALNLGIGEARGEYIARMDGDDISLPHRFDEQVRFLDANPNCAVLGGRLELIDENSSKLSTPFPYYGTNREIRRILPLRNPMPHPALMMRKSALFAVGGYKYGHSSEDYELFLRMSRNPEIEFANLDSVVLLYRRHSQQGTSPEYFRRRFAEMSGYLLTEVFRRGSPKYLLGIMVVHPWARKLRGLVKRS